MKYPYIGLFLVWVGYQRRLADAFVKSFTASPRSTVLMATEQQQGGRNAAAGKVTQDQVNITSMEDLNQYFSQVTVKNSDLMLRKLNVVGDTQCVDASHPVAQLLHHRKLHGKTDKAKVALAIEGGGMRGCISAGMICAIHHLNLTDCFDEIYGSSAGGVVGAYFNTGQLPWFGPEVYYDQLPTAGKQFIDTKRLLRSLGLGLLDPRLLKDVVVRRRDGGKPVLNLPYLLKRTVQETKPLNWTKFVERQKVQPLKIVASGLKSEKPVVMSMENGAFDSIDGLTDAMHASCLLPGIAGPIMNLNLETKELVLGNRMDTSKYEPMADALVYEPLPYRSALAEGATHVVVCRSRPDGVDVTGKGGPIERLIFRRFFLRKNRLPRIFDYFNRQLHKKLYAEDILRLNEEAQSKRDCFDTTKPHLLPIAMPPGSPEITRLEKDRKTIFEGFRNGFARAYDCLVADPKEKGQGAKVAAQYFPDEILDYDPLKILSKEESAFEVYMREHGVSPKVWIEEVEKQVADL